MVHVGGCSEDYCELVNSKSTVEIWEFQTELSADSFEIFESTMTLDTWWKPCGSAPKKIA